MLHAEIARQALVLVLSVTASESVAGRFYLSPTPRLVEQSSLNGDEGDDGP